MALITNTTNVVNNDRSFGLGTATPGSPATGMIRWNTSLTRFEVYNGTAWVAMITTGSSTQPSWGWGGNNSGTLGDGTTSSRLSPVSVLGGFTDWVTVLTGTNGTSLGLRGNGTLWAWGINSGGAVGDGTTSNRSSPVSVLGGFTDWIQCDVSGGSSGSAHAIRSNGTAWAWGWNGNGQLGNGSSGAAAATSSPVSVVGGFTNWKRISCRGSHALGLRGNGTLWAWGQNNVGQLGDGTTTQRASPVSVVGGFTDWVDISGGPYGHSLAIRGNGTAWAWGRNYNGELGDSTTSSRSSPVSVVGGFTDWVQVSVGRSFSAGIRANGTAWTWGTSQFGNLGDGTTSSKRSPVSVVGGFTDWVQISAGQFHVSAIRSNGTAWGWGSNTTGRLGDGTTTNRSSPVSVVGGFTDWVQINAGGDGARALRAV